MRYDCRVAYLIALLARGKIKHQITMPIAYLSGKPEYLGWDKMLIFRYLTDVSSSKKFIGKIFHMPIFRFLNILTEVPMSTSRHQTPPTTPNSVFSQDGDVLHTVELSQIVQISTVLLTHEQHDDEVAATPDPHLIRADTEQFVGDGHDATEQQVSQKSQLLASKWPAGRRPDNCFVSEGSPTWRGHLQDLYASSGSDPSRFLSSSV